MVTCFFSYKLTGSLRDIQLGWEMGGKGLEMALVVYLVDCLLIATVLKGICNRTNQHTYVLKLYDFNKTSQKILQNFSCQHLNFEIQIMIERDY